MNFTNTTDELLYQLIEKGDIIDQVSDNLIYVGYLDKNVTDLSLANCIIKRVETVDGVTQIKWARGKNKDYHQIWDNRAEYEYYFKKQ